MSINCPPLLPIAVVSDDAKLAGQLSCALAVRGRYLPVLDGPRLTRPDGDNEVTRRVNALARMKTQQVYLGGLPEDANAAMSGKLPPNRVRQVDGSNIGALLSRPELAKNPPLKWGRDQIGIGILKAQYSGRLIEFGDEPSPVETITSKLGHVVICEAGENLSEVIAANYAYALGAGMQLIPATSDEECERLLEAYYSIDAPGSSPPEARARLYARLRELCGDIELPQGGSLTFVTKRLPFGVAFPERPSTHLFAYPDLGVAVANGFAAEQAGSRGVNVAVVVDPEKTAAPEIEAAKKLLPARRIFLRGYSGVAASVRRVTEMVELFPYDLLIFATHCGDASGYRWTYEYTDSDGKVRRLVVDIAIGVADTDDPDLLHVSQFMRHHSLDGVDWNDPQKDEKIHVGTAIKDFYDQHSGGDKLEPVVKELIPRVAGSAAMQMFDHHYIAMPQSLADEGTPIIINNACVSWHELASRFTFVNARAYIGTLYPVSDGEAEAIVVKLLDKFFGKPLAHALWSAQNATYGANSDRRPYVVTGVYPQRLRATREDVPKRILQKLRSAHQMWKGRAEQQPDGQDKRARQLQQNADYLKAEADAFAKRWFSPSDKA